VFRKAAIVVAIAMLAFVTACGSNNKSAGDTSAAGGAVATASAASSSTCPTTETKKFAKTLFVTDAALAGGAFKHWIYTPAREGKFSKGAKGRVSSIVKAVAAGAFTINRLNAVKTNAQSDPTLCKLTIAPITKFTSAVQNIAHGGKHGLGSINTSEVTSANGLLGQLHSGAASGGNAFTDNQNANIGG
jgi:hypothetical protein